MKRYRMYVVFTAMIGLLAFLGAAVAAETEYAAGTASAVVLLGPGNGETVIESVYAVSDKAGATVKLYAWDKVAPLRPTAAPAATNIVAVDNSATTLTTSDKVVYVYADGTLLYRTVSSATASNVTLNANLSKAGSVADKLYEVTTQTGELGFDNAAAGVGTNKFGVFEGPVVYRALGPFYCLLDGTSNAVLQVTARQ